MKPIRAFLARRKTARLRVARSLDAAEIRRLQDDLVAMGAPAIAPLAECLAHGEARGPALEALARLVRDDTVPALFALLCSPNPAVVSGVRSVVCSSHDFDARHVLDALDAATLPRTALEALLAAHLVRLPAEAIAGRIQGLPREAQMMILRTLDQVPDPNVPLTLLPVLADEDPWLRVQLARILAQRPAPGVVPGLERLLRDPVKAVRLEAVQALHALGARESTPALLESLRDADPNVQAAAIEALTALADVRAVPALVELLGDESEEVRRGAVEVLNEVATTDALTDLVRALRDEDWWVRVRAADALGRLGGPRVVEAAAGLLRDPDDALRRHAVEILNAVPDARAVPAFIAALEDADWWVRERAIDALGRTGDPRAAAPLLALAGGEPALAVLATRALPGIAAPVVLAGLIELLDSPVAEVRREAQGALLRLPREAFAGTDLHRLERARARIAATPGAESPLRERLPGRITDPPLRREAPALAAAGPPSGAPPSPLPSYRPTFAPTFQLDFSDLPTGQDLLDRYTIQRRIGRGGFGTVYLATDRVIQEDIILKVLNPQLSLDDEAARRFVQELKLARRVAHRGVIRIHDFLDLGGARAISMEYFPGRDLGRLLAETGALPPRRALHFAHQVCDALAAAHAEGVVHRDIKPANILVDANDETRLVDFGLAAVHATGGDGSRLTKSGLLIGTPEYMAPEQITNEVVDHRADLYALGVVMYEMIAGRKPYVAETPVKVLFRHLEGDAEPLGAAAPGTPGDVAALVARAMARDASARPAHAAELRDAIERTLERLPGEE